MSGCPSSVNAMEQRVNRLTEKRLVERAQSGDSHAFASLYEMHKHRVYAICLRFTRERMEAEDCSQEAFLQCFLRLSTFRGESALSTWLYRLTVNVVLMRLRRKLVPVVSLESSSASEGSGRTPLPNACPVDDLRLRDAIDRITLHRALRQLAPGYRTILMLHDVEGKAHREIARELGCSIGNSKSQLHQARVCLRRFLQGSLRPRPRRAFAVPASL
jgi:RNA polymerase sigma-70 factor (ECF subfamily)